MKRLTIVFILLILFLCGCNTDTSNGSDLLLSDSYYTDLYNFDQTGKFGRGINLGNFFECPYLEGGEGCWVGTTVQQEFFAIIKNAGFKTVRIPIRWSDYTDTTPDYTLNTTFVDRIKEVVDQALAVDLIVVLDFHHYIEIMDPDDSNTLTWHKTRLNIIWGQICDKFTEASYSVDTVYFELLNEPMGRVTYEEWNNIIADLTTLIWTTKGQTNRKIVISPANWGSIYGLQELDLPAACNNTNTIITFHYYDPLQFTHQGASWTDGSDQWIGTTWTGTASEQKDVTEDLNDAIEWNQANGNFDLWMGEFGVYSLYVDKNHQRAWTAFVAREAEKLGISWAYWEFCASFGAYDWKSKEWRTHLLDGPLIPQTKQTVPE